MSVTFVVLAWAAFTASRLLRRWRVPELVGFLAAGALVGPAGFGVVTRSDLRSLATVSTLAIAVLMFLVGERVSLRAIRQARWVPLSAIAQYVVAGGLVYAAARAVGATEAVSLLLAVLAGAGAPMTVASVVTSSGARGPYASGLIGTHAVSDALAAVCFAAALPLARLLSTPGASETEALLRFARLGIGGAVLGVALGWFVAKLASRTDSQGEALLLALVNVLAAAAITDAAGLSLPLASLVMGATAASFARVGVSEQLFAAVRTIEQPLYLLFFALAGAAIHLDELPELGVIGAAYLGARTVGKLVGGTLGGMAGGLGLRAASRLGVDHLPQAGVAVALATVASEVLPVSGAEVAAVVLGSAVIFELVGPLLVARHLQSDGEGGEAPRGRVVVAAESGPLPPWLIDACGRAGAVTLVTPAGEEQAASDLVRELADGGATVSYLQAEGNLLAGATRMLEQGERPDLLVLSGSAAHSRAKSLADRFQCPVVVLPDPERGGEEDDDEAEAADPGH